MEQTTVSVQRLEPHAMPASIRSVQPGGGTVAGLELWWGRVRRWWLRRFRPKYVESMNQRRRGECPGCPHDIVDARDLKLYRNVCGYWFALEDDRFQWRERLPLARDALAEVVVLGGPFVGAALVCVWVRWWFPAAGLVMIAMAVAAFFRDPRRAVPADPRVLISPADGTVVDIEEVAQQAPLDGPAVKIGIFLSLFNVHINRSPLEARVVALEYRPGKFHSATGRRAAIENERMEIVLEEEAAPHRRFVVRQIAGAVARRIVCALRPGQTVGRGEKFGLIKLGSRTEIIMPKQEGLEVLVQTGSRVRAGTTVLARYGTEGRVSK